VHPSDRNDVHEFYLMVEDIEGFVEQLKLHQVNCTPVQNRGWGLLTQLTLPGGGQIGVYEPRHVRPRASRARSVAKNTTTRLSGSSRKRLKKPRRR
jgi:hypothetical protein